MNRFANWPVRIEMLSRFRSRTEQKHILTELARGMVDVVIGTHRLLQRDVKFNDLGLLIIDEEHRFGVTHKERIKKLRATVDTIAMSATPIPRTLHLSLSGLRDISIINTPPANRLAIRTYVSEFNEDIVRGAILGELSRGGQVFFVHNRVEEIYRMEELLKRLVPEAKVVVGHGQMEEHELEEVMIKFLEKKANVLLCTTIIESGIDVPTANTIIINRADRMGLAQLYQLRGRVGRSNVQAYAYLLTPAEETISPIAKKRLALLQRYTELGSGFQIAMHDLEIRGAGNILGAEQSGHINAIGYEMYMDLLERTIRHLQGQPERVKVDVEITLPIPAYIPTDYIADEGQRLITYRRLSSLEDIAALDDVAKELNERYGKIPDLVNNLLGIVEMRINAKKFLVESINFDGKIFAVKFSPKTGIDPNKILNLVKQAPQKYAFRQPATLLMKESAKHPKDIFSVLRALFGTLEK
jgi:transcription-repair coupling factor (superfamily II helicase)